MLSVTKDIRNSSKSKACPSLFLSVLYLSHERQYYTSAMACFTIIHLASRRAAAHDLNNNNCTDSEIWRVTLETHRRMERRNKSSISLFSAENCGDGLAIPAEFSYLSSMNTCTVEEEEEGARKRRKQVGRIILFFYPITHQIPRRFGRDASHMLHNQSQVFVIDVR